MKKTKRKKLTWKRVKKSLQPAIDDFGDAINKKLREELGHMNKPHHLSAEGRAMAKLAEAARDAQSPQDTRSTSETHTNERFLRVRQIVGDPKAVPPVLPIIPVSRSCWWQWVADGKAPKPVKLHGVTVWRESDIQRFMREAK